VGDLLLGDDIFLGQHLHGVNSFRVPFTHLEDLAECSTSNQLEDFKVFRREVDLALREVRVIEA
jgi:hypothetical protein